MLSRVFKLTLNYDLALVVFYNGLPLASHHYLRLLGHKSLILIFRQGKGHLKIGIQ